MTTYSGIAEHAQRPDIGRLVNLYTLDITSITNNSSDVFYFTNDTISGVNPEWNHREYFAIPMETTGFAADGKQLPRPRIKVGNVGTSTSLSFVGWISAYEDLIGATITRTRTFMKYLDGQPEADGSAQFPTDLYVITRKTQQTKTLIEWELAGYLDFVGKKIPNRQVLKNNCTQRYRIFDTATGTFDYTNATCPYTENYFFKSSGEYTTISGEDRCGKSLSDCKARYIDTTNAAAVTISNTPPSHNVMMDLWLDTSSVPAEWFMYDFDTSSWVARPKYLVLPTWAFPCVGSTRAR